MISNFSVRSSATRYSVPPSAFVIRLATIRMVSSNRVRSVCFDSEMPILLSSSSLDSKYPESGRGSGAICVLRSTICVVQFLVSASQNDLFSEISTVTACNSRRRQVPSRPMGHVLPTVETPFRIIAETASDAIITIDEDCTIVSVNFAAERIFGYSIPEMLGQAITMLMPDHLRHPHKDGLSRLMQSGEPHLKWD